MATIIISSFLWSCQDVDVFPTVDPPSSGAQPSEEGNYREGMTVLGKRLDNPYTVENMRAAWASLVVSDPSLRASDIRIVPSHLYIRFKPQSEEELGILNRDSTLLLYSYPLDYEIVQRGDYYRDPEVPEGQPTYQYCSVPVGKVLPSGVEYELLAEAFIPEEIEVRSRVVPSARLGVGWDDLADVLVHESNRLTGNLDSPPEGTRPRTVRKIQAKLPSRWRPSGRVRSWDDDMGSTRITRWVANPYYVPNAASGGINSARSLYCNPSSYQYNPTYCSRLVAAGPGANIGEPNISRTVTLAGTLRPLEGVQVRARWFIITRKGYTDDDGRYSVDGTFRYNVNYSVKFERYQFSIRSGAFGQASYDGPRMTGSWDLSIRQPDLTKFYADIHRGAYHYYYKDIKGLRRPPLNGIFSNQTTISAMNSRNPSARGNHGPTRRFYGGAEINVWRWQSSTTTRSSIEIYSTTIHELAHASHWKMGGAWNYLDADEKVRQSWARGVEWELTRMRYQSYEGREGDSKPTLVVADLIDNIAWKYVPDLGGWVRGRDLPRNKGFYGSYDLVEGYTIRQIEDALVGLHNWNSWRDNIIRRYNNNTEGHVNTLFYRWGTYGP